MSRLATRGMLTGAFVAVGVQQAAVLSGAALKVGMVSSVRYVSQARPVGSVTQCALHRFFLLGELTVGSQHSSSAGRQSSGLPLQQCSLRYPINSLMAL